jgi:hypothetical protein
MNHVEQVDKVHQEHIHRHKEYREKNHHPLRE